MTTNDEQRETGAVPALIEGMESGRYHLKNGLYFDKRDEGYVRICRASTALAGETPRAVCEVSPNEWASVVAFLSAGGENGATYGTALAFHKGAMPEDDRLTRIERIVSWLRRVPTDCWGNPDVASRNWPTPEELGRGLASIAAILQGEV